MLGHLQMKLGRQFLASSSHFVILYLSIFVGPQLTPRWNHLPYARQTSNPGAQPGIVEGRGPIHEKGHLKTFIRRYSLWLLFFRSISGGSTAIVALKPNDSCCQFLSWEGRKKGAGNEAPENFNKHAIFILGKRPFWYRECTTKGAILFICWKWQGSRPPCPP